ncbi:hypothetical protein ACFL5O_06220 [Myxococcota bacterium]
MDSWVFQCLILTEYLAHYHTERNHQGLGNRLFEEPSANSQGTGTVRYRERLGRVLPLCYGEAG